MEQTLERLDQTALHNFYMLYENYCVNHSFKTSVRDFIIWMAEEGYIDAE